jgi:hypothetical protein
MKTTLIRLSLFLPLLLSISCSSYNYSTANRDRTVKINSDNLVDFQVFSPRTSNKLSTASSGKANPVLESLKKDHLTLLLSHPNYDPQLIVVKRTPRAKALAKDVALGIFTFGIPIIVDVFKSDFYKISSKTNEFNVHFEFKQSYMSDEYAKIKDSKNPDDFKDWLSKYQKSVLFQKVLDQKDSLELTIALFQETENAIDEYIASHQSSTYLPEAIKIKEEMVAARELFAKTKTENTVASYENYLAKYPRSLNNKEAHKLLTIAAEKVSLSQGTSNMIQYMNKYLIPNASFFNKTELEERKSKISKAIDNQLIKENIKNDPKKTYEYYSNLWKSYTGLKSQNIENYLNHLELTYGYLPKICDLLFIKLKEANTLEKQALLVSKINSEFPNLDIYDSIKNPLISVLENTQKGSGIVKLFNVGYIPHYFNNMSERDPLIGRDYYIYKDSTFQALKEITYEEVSLNNGQLNGVTKCYKGSQIDLSLNMVNNSAKDISYYQGGSLVQTTFFPVNEGTYYYEYENGTNITLKVINDVLAQLNAVESNLKGYMKTKNYEQMVVDFKKVPVILDPAIELISNNPIPKEKGSNLLLSKAKILDGLLNTAQANKEAEIKAAEQKQILANQKIQKEAQKKREAENARVKTLFKEVCSCECCGKSFIRQNGWFYHSGQSYRLIEPSGSLFAGEVNTMYQSLQLAWNYSPVEAMRHFNYCSKVCAHYCQ